MNRMLHVFIHGIILILVFSSFAAAQYPVREDAIWARTITNETITLDGVLDEAAWAKAESLVIRYGESSGLPTSGWRPEFQPEAVNDPTDAVVKFLVAQDNQLYMAIEANDLSVVGSKDWARWDGVLMGIRNRANKNRPTPQVEYFYTYWYPELPAGQTPGVGAPPRFLGTYGNFNAPERTPELVAAWDGATVVHGGQANDNQREQGYTMEMRVALTDIGYDVNKPNGEIIELNFSIWDCDFLYEGDVSIINSTRTHWQNPWGNADANNVGRVHVHPDVTVDTAVLPELPPDVIVPNNNGSAEPVIDGVLDENVWTNAYTFTMAWGDSVVRASYPGVGPYRSGQYQPEFNGVRADILDPSFATIKMFFRGNHLYLAADVNDMLVQGTSVFDRMDGVRFMIGDRQELNLENSMLFQKLQVNFDDNGDPVALEFLPVMVDSSDTEFAVTLKGNTTVNVKTDIDEGYIVELKVDLTYLGYPAGLGDHLLFMGVMLADGDSFDDPANDYGTRTWWFREHDGGPAAAWMYMDPELVIAIHENPHPVRIPETIELYGNYPNPFNPTTKLSYSLPFAGEVTLHVYNMMGQQVIEVGSTQKSAGLHEMQFDGQNLESGIYFYQIRLNDTTHGRNIKSQTGKMALIK
ncbi:T9SS type A sorting domain-containing protein [candidate division KSB1 bacterium]|nr:T9SS type A sorting domain-containing protein [candidate division KSB1 bacterium]